LAVSDELDELRRLGDSFSATIHEQGRQVESGLRSVSDELARTADRISAAIGSGGGVVTAPVPAGGDAGAAGAPAATASGILQVRVVNERVPVFVVNPPPAPERPGGLFGAIATGIGGFIGGIVGGIVGGVASPVLLFADIAALMLGLPGILDRVLTALRLIRTIANELITGLRNLITLLFNELTAAGILPVSRLIASLLFLIDRGITLVLMHVQPIILWLERVIETVTTWLGQYISRLAAYVNALVNALATFLAAYVTYLIDSIIRPAIDAMVRDAIRSAVAALAGALFAALAAAGEILVAAGTYVGQLLYRAMVQALNYLPGVSIAVPPSPATPDWGALARSGFAGGRLLGQALADELFGPAPRRPPAAPGTSGAPGAPGTPPTFRGPGFRAPELHLPDMPSAAPQLERLLQTPPATTGPEQRQGQGQPLTVNGGVSVAVRAETVSMENAEETARVIAQHVMDELARLTQAERFARGLPTVSVA
jgi:hypothetical protein